MDDFIDEVESKRTLLDHIFVNIPIKSILMKVGVLHDVYEKYVTSDSMLIDNQETNSAQIVTNVVVGQATIGPYFVISKPQKSQQIQPLLPQLQTQLQHRLQRHLRRRQCLQNRPLKQHLRVCRNPTLQPPKKINLHRPQNRPLRTDRTKEEAVAATDLPLSLASKSVSTRTSERQTLTMPQ